MSNFEDADGEEEANGLVLDADESSELQGIFATIFPQYLIPIEELIQQILDGQVSAEIVDGLRAAVKPLISAAKSIGVSKIEEVLQEFKSTIDAIDTDAPVVDEDDVRDGLIDVFYRLKELVHTLSDPDVEQEESGSSDTAAPPRPARPQTLAGSHGDFVKRLAAVEGIESAEVQRILAAGISSQEQVLGATADEIAAVAGLDEQLAERIQKAFGGRRRRGRRLRRSPPSARKVVGRSAKIKKPSAPEPTISMAEFESGIALFSLVRERIRLAERLENEAAPTQRLHAQLDELTRLTTQLHGRLQRSEGDLAHENETIRRYEGEVASLAEEVVAAKHASLHATDTGDGVDLAVLKERLHELQHKIEQRLRLG